MMEGNIGQGLLGPDWGKGREEVLGPLRAAYMKIMNEKVGNLLMWDTAMDAVLNALRTKFARVGLTAPSLFTDTLRDKLVLMLPSENANEHMRLVRALLTDYSAQISDHIRTRMATNGNVHFSFSGPTGMGKSSGALALADWIKPLQPDTLVEHISIDIAELPKKLRNKTPGDTVIQDEYVQGAGEGASTARNLFANLEDTLRASQVNLFVLSPRKQEHGTMQAEFELLQWNWDRKFSLFMVWHEGLPRGVVALPWARDELWNAYSPWKEANVERTLRAQFKDPAYKAKTAMDAFENSKVVEYLTLGDAKPKLKHFHTALVDFQAQMLSGEQAKGIAAWMHDRCYDFDRTRDNFVSLFGVTPNKGFQEVAKRCYDE